MKKENFSQINLEKKLDKKNISKFHLYWIESYLNHCRHEKKLGKANIKSLRKRIDAVFSLERNRSNKQYQDRFKYRRKVPHPANNC